MPSQPPSTPEAAALGAAALLEEIHQLLLLKGENPFRARAYEKGAQALGGRTDLLERARTQTLTEIAGIGKGMAEILGTYLTQGTVPWVEELRQSIPEGLRELSSVRGIGPKAAARIVDELGIRSLGELEYACRENRLALLKGFGPKSQAKILEDLEFKKTTAGQLTLSEALPVADALGAALTREGLQWSEAGALRRRLEVLDRLEFVVRANPAGRALSQLQQTLQAASSLPLRLFEAAPGDWGGELYRRTGSDGHLAHAGVLPGPFETEEAAYRALNLPWIEPAARETGEEVQCARAGHPPRVVQLPELQGVFHLHTTRSDGAGSLEQMVEAARGLGLKYLGVSDHSQSAVYAQGLKPEALREQRAERDRIQEKFDDIRIFWGIESDILLDGSLDYDPATLGAFDFVIASIHTRGKMDRDAMTERLVRAVRNPATRFIGHLTGRILLGRPPFDVDVERVIREASEHQVAIELNAHPSRLDIDWRWGALLRKHQTMTSINPDAHEAQGLSDIRYGVWMAQKALLPHSLILNTRSADQVAAWLARK